MKMKTVRATLPLPRVRLVGDDDVDVEDEDGEDNVGDDVYDHVDDDVYVDDDDEDQNENGESNIATSLCPPHATIIHSN